MSARTLFAVKLIRRRIPTEELLADVAAVARRLQTDRLSTFGYTQLGKFNSCTVSRRLGSWTAAMRRLGLRPAHLFHPDPNRALVDLRRVARRLRTPSPLLADYRRHGRFTTDAIRKLFGAWHRALLAAGLRPTQYRSLTDAELFANLKNVWQQLNRQPRIKDLRPPLSLCTVGPYLTRFGTWTLSLSAFQSAMHPHLATADPPTPPRRPVRISTYINWRLRYQIMQRDHFRCQACGRSPAANPGITLQIDHILPRGKGGASTKENLQTLCNRCNSGKGDTL